MTLRRWSEGTVDLFRIGKQPAGTWFAHPLGPNSMGYERMLGGTRVMLYVACPLCSKTMTLGHAIAADGALSPSLVCPYKPCKWHVFEKLEGWTGGASPQSGRL